MRLDFADGERPAEGILQAGNLVLQDRAAAVGRERILAKPRGGALLNERAMALHEKSAADQRRHGRR